MNIPESKILVQKTVTEAVNYCGSQVELAKRAGITQGAIGKYLRGDSLPTGVTANKLSSAVDFTISRSNFAAHIFTKNVTS